MSDSRVRELSLTDGTMRDVVGSWLYAVGVMHDDEDITKLEVEPSKDGKVLIRVTYVKENGK